MKVWIDFNNDGMFNNAEELIGGMMENAHPPTTRPPAGLKVSLTDAIPATAVRNQVLSLRVLNELSTIYGYIRAIPIDYGCLHGSIFWPGRRISGLLPEMMFS